MTHSAAPVRSSSLKRAYFEGLPAWGFLTYMGRSSPTRPASTSVLRSFGDSFISLGSSALSWATSCEVSWRSVSAMSASGWALT